MSSMLFICVCKKQTGPGKDTVLATCCAISAQRITLCIGKVCIWFLIGVNSWDYFALWKPEIKSLRAALLLLERYIQVQYRGTWKGELETTTKLTYILPMRKESLVCYTNVFISHPSQLFEHSYRRSKGVGDKEMATQYIPNTLECIRKECL